jgi:hypothetical protein
MDELTEELLRQTDELNDARDSMFQLQEENESMRKTIETILRIKCKRGEGAFALNVDLRMCVKKNIVYALSKMQRDIATTGNKPVDVVADAIVDLLIGETQEDIPCAVLDANTIVYKTATNLWYASGVSDFAIVVRDSIGVNQLVEHFNDNWRDGQFTHVYNLFLHEPSFIACLKKALKKYNDL